MVRKSVLAVSVASVWTAVAAAPTVFGQDDAIARYAPDRIVDHLHMKLEVAIADMNVPKLDAVQTLTVTPFASPVQRVTLDARLLTIHSVESPDRQCAFEHDGRTLTITLQPAIQPGQVVDIVTRYTVEDPPRGLYWTPESPAWPGRPAQLFTQGQTEFNSYWFPCHDHPNERLTTELLVAVPPGFTASSNGRLLSKERTVETITNALGERSLRSRTVVHWLQDKPHPPYLVTLAVGQWEVIDVGPGDLPMPVYAPPGRGRDVPATFGRTPEMIELFGRLIDEPYPWDRYAQVIVHNFPPGGMENTSATTLRGSAILRPEAVGEESLEGLIAHELAHQWFGDLITCKTWDQVWLNEGFATFMSSMWTDYAEGPDAYQAAIQRSFDGVIRRDNGRAPSDQPMVSKIYSDTWAPFGMGGSPYSRGAAILHMLRARLGNELFFECLSEYVDRFKLQSVETDQLRQVFEGVTGESMERFFHQWCRRPGVPRLDVRITWDEDAGQLTVGIEQAQTIDRFNPAFAVRLPFMVWRGAGPARWLIIETTERTASESIALDGEPDLVVVDPELTFLAELSITQPINRWIAQLHRGPTHAARVQAARAMRTDRTEAAGDALAATAINKERHPQLRVEAVRALAAREDRQRLVALANSEIDDAEVRSVIMSALAELAGEGAEPGSLGGELTASILANHARTDRSSRVRAAALRGLGSLKAAEHLDVVLAAADVESQDDQVRQAALDAIRLIDDPRGLDAAARYAAPGHDNRTRPQAIRAVASLGRYDRDRAFAVLAPLADDREARTREAVGRAMVRLADERGLEVLRRMHRAARIDEDREEASRLIEQLRTELATQSEG